MNAPIPEELLLDRQTRTLTLVYSSTEHYPLSCEFLRVHSPSAEVRGHGREILQTGKRWVNINALEPVGQYAVKIVFDDGHQTGLYSWDYLYTLAREQERLWADYLARLEAAGEHREGAMIGRWSPSS